MLMKWIIGRGAAAIEGRSSMSFNRKELVERFSPVLRKVDTASPLTVGNGEFAFTADVTGLPYL